MKKSIIGVWIALTLLTSCTMTKFVPDGSYLLDEVHIETDNREVKPSSLSLYVRQNPNSKWFSLLKTQLYVYNWSGPDSTQWASRLCRKLGDAPVIYNEKEAIRTAEEMQKAVQNMGYMGATVERHEQRGDKKLKLTYSVHTGRPYRVRSLRYDIADEGIGNCLQDDSLHSLLATGMYFDVNQLDAERQRITDLLQQNGYYKFNKEYISYTADTVRGSYLVDLIMHVAPFVPRGGDQPTSHRQYYIGKVNFITDYNVMESSNLGSIEVNDSVHYRGMPIYYKDNLYLRPKILANNLRFESGSLYNEQQVQRTYSNFGRLQALKYTNIRFFENQIGDTATLNAYVMLTKNKQQSISFEVEGTNSAGDLGTAASVSFTHRNLFKGSESFTLKLRGAYEAVSGLQSGYRHEDYTELGAEATINFPRFMFPFLSSDFRNRIRATSELGLQYNYQFRPEFTRIVASAGWSYRWSTQQQRSQHRIDLIDVNYLYMPWISDEFKNKFLENQQNQILKYNYEDRLIVRTGYSYTYNSAGRSLVNNTVAANSYSLRFNFESAGNMLYLLARMSKMQQNEEGEYSVLNIPFAQYIKAEFDFARNLRIDNRNTIAYHIGAGIAIPYGNAKIVPFEERFFSGGANSVRGWSVRALGPGIFPGDGNFLNQSGDIKLDASVEYRTRLFWKFRGALFVDAGNIWTLRSYDDQPGGKFYFDRFYKQIAVAYGLGLRMDLDFFIIRFDGGMKALNPIYKSGRDRYPILHPRFSRDFAFHFAVGYPF